MSPEHYKYNAKYNLILTEREFIRVVVQGYDEWEHAYSDYYGVDCNDFIEHDMLAFLASLIDLPEAELQEDNDTTIVHSDDDSSGDSNSTGDDSSTSDASSGDIEAELQLGLEDLEIEIQAQFTLRNRRDRRLPDRT
jgi:hypothetical protein